MLSRLASFSLALLASALAIYVAVRLIESVATALIVIAAIAGGTIIAGFVVRILWRRGRINRW
jgi:hypothetical protein